NFGETMDNISKDVIVKPRWIRFAKGNLISDQSGGCDIGDDHDSGLYFSYGSLVGWPGKSNNNGTGYIGNLSLSDPVCQPKDCSYTQADFGASTMSSIGNVPLIPFNTLGTDGKGDPCYYYLGNNWRLPTSQEIALLFGKQISANETIGTLLWDDFPNWERITDGFRHLPTKTTIIGAGRRVNSGPVEMNMNAYWTGTERNNEPSRFEFNNNYAYPTDAYGRNQALPVRCVQDIK
ncbi:MAG: hypothetical protein ACRC26_01245, partial [Bacteroidales bacterium]